MKVRWSPEAAEDLERVTAWFDARSLHASATVVRAIYSATRQLRQFPRRGRPGWKPGTRELVIPDVAVVVYRVSDEAVEVLRIIHGSQDRT